VTTKNHKRIVLGSNERLQGENPAVKHLSRGTFSTVADRDGRCGDGKSTAKTEWGKPLSEFIN